MSSPVSMTRNGRFVALRCAGGIHVVDVLGIAPRLTVAAGDAATFACVGAELWIVDESLRRVGERVTVHELAAGSCWFPVHGRRLVAARRDGTELRTIGRDDVVALPALGGEVAAAAALFGGRAVALWARGEAGDALVVASNTGALLRGPPHRRHRPVRPRHAVAGVTDDLRRGLPRSRRCARDQRLG